MLGDALGGPVGGALGSAAGGLLSDILGFGDYSVTTNTLMGDAHPQPSFYNGGDGVVMCHREFIANIEGSTDFVITEYPIQPGLYRSFPWLSTVAEQFSQYRLLGLVYEYNPTSGPVATASPSSGAVIFATNYNPTDQPFPNKRIMESYEFSSSAAPFNRMHHPVECAKFSNVTNSLYTRTGSNSNMPLALTDVGNFYVATQGMASAYTCGELWVTYHIQLTRPRILPGIPSNATVSHYTSFKTSGSTNYNYPTQINSDLYTVPGVSFSVTAINNLTVYLAEAGCYMVALLFPQEITGNTPLVIVTGVGAGGNAALMPGMGGSGMGVNGVVGGSDPYSAGTAVSTYDGSDTQQGMAFAFVRVTTSGPTNYVNFVTTSNSLSDTHVDIYIVPFTGSSNLNFI